MDRRQVNKTLLAAPALLAGGAAVAAMDDPDDLQAQWRRFVPEGLDIPAVDDTLQLSQEQWRERLDDARFRVLRKSATEKPGSSALNAEKREGVYLCAGCGLPVFTSAMKYDSGTGWPSFFTTIPGVFETKWDLVMLIPRTEYHCARCGGHHGHVFDDGPEPTGKRWCNNGLALRFEPLS